MRDLAKRLTGMREGLSVLISVADSSTPGVRIEQGTASLFETVLPSEHPTAVSAFLENWEPDLCIWIWGLLRPNLILETAARSCPLYLIDADAGGFDDRRDRWLPDLTRQLLTKFSAIYTRSDHGYRRLTSLGASPERVTRASPLMAGGAALPCADSDLTELSAAMGGRPAWFAANVLPVELPIVLAAHKQALRLSHRLLLILQPSAPEDETVAAELAADAEQMSGVKGFIDTQTPIKPFVIGEAQAALSIAEELKHKQVWVTAIRPPTVATGTARLRITLTANHSQKQVLQLTDSLLQAIERSNDSESKPSIESSVELKKEAQ